MSRLLPVLLCLLTCASAQDKLRVAAFLNDHMVLQREQTIPVWGQAAPGAKIAVTFRDSTAEAVADASGQWMAELPPQKVGKPGSLSVQSGSERLLFEDVLVGEVWICSGQSNMEWTVARSNDAEAEIAAADFPAIRFFDVPNRYSPSPQDDVEASWQICSPETAANFSAVAYFFGRELWQELGVPIGLVLTNWGGTPAEAWTPLSTLEQKNDYAELVADYREASRILAEEPDIAAQMKAAFDAFNARADALAASPPEPLARWFDPEATFADAQPVRPDTPLLAETDGLAHVRLVFSLSAEQAARRGARLQLGQIDNFDASWINGVRVGATLSDTPGSREAIRDYEIPEGLLKTGPNVVLVQIVDVRRIADFGRNIDFPKIVWSGDEALALKEGWEMALIEDIGPRPDRFDDKMKDMGTFLWNAMVAPLVPTAFRGVIWYQGESNTDRAEQYRSLFPDMIRGWRAAWGRDDFPFYFVQLANFSGRRGWPELREAQRETLALPNTGMAVAIDIGDPQNIHPGNKQDVGRRLALWALAETYNVTEPANFLGHLPFIGRSFQRPIPHSGPLIRGAEVEGVQVRLRFDHVYKGLRTTDGGPVKSFELSDANGVFHPAIARIEGDDILVHHPEIIRPSAIRYAWHINPEVNLVNSSQLPASPFQLALQVGVETPKTGSQ